MFKYHSICLLFLFILAFTFRHNKVNAQPLLPDIALVSENGINVLTWHCQYDGLKSIAVQRSNDSNFNYTTIGYVRDIKKGVQYYLDGHPTPGNNWYRVTLVFGSNLAWTSNRIRIFVDSAQIVKNRVLPPNDSLQKYIAKMRTKTVKVVSPDSAATSFRKDSMVVTSTTPKIAASRNHADSSAAVIAPETSAAATKTASPGNNNSSINPAVKTDLKNVIDSASKPVVKSIVIPTIEIPDLSEVNTYSYIRSHYVFTNPFTGHVNVEIDDAVKHKYSIDFYDQNNVRIMEIPRITEPHVIIDKRNFQRTGLYKFELIKDKEKLETGYITIY